MSYVELLVKIDEKLYNRMKTYQGLDDTYVAIKHGMPLQKGHGKIGDLDKLIKAMRERNDDNGGEPYNAVDRGYDLAFQHMVEESKECVILEADTESEVQE